MTDLPKPRGCAPYGFEYIDGRLVTNAREQYIIAQCRGLASRGFTLEAIVRGLNAIGQNRAGGRFTIEQVRRMLRPRDKKGVRIDRASKPAVVRFTEEEWKLVESITGARFSPWARKHLVEAAKQEKAAKEGRLVSRSGIPAPPLADARIIAAADAASAALIGRPAGDIAADIAGPSAHAYENGTVHEAGDEDGAADETLTDELARTLYGETSSSSSKRSGRKRSTVTGNGSVSSGEGAPVDGGGIAEGGGEGIVDAPAGDDSGEGVEEGGGAEGDL